MLQPRPARRDLGTPAIRPLIYHRGIAYSPAADEYFVIDRLAETGQSVGIWGRTGRAPGELAYPWAAVVNRRGHVVIIDSGNNRIQLTTFR